MFGSRKDDISKKDKQIILGAIPRFQVRCGLPKAHSLHYSIWEDRGVITLECASVNWGMSWVLRDGYPVCTNIIESQDFRFPHRGQAILPGIGNAVFILLRDLASCSVRVERINFNLPVSNPRLTYGRAASGDYIIDVIS